MIRFLIKSLGNILGFFKLKEVFFVERFIRKLKLFFIVDIDRWSIWSFDWRFWMVIIILGFGRGI